MRVYQYGLLNYGGLIALSLLFPKGKQVKLVTACIIVQFAVFMLAMYPVLIWREFGATLTQAPQPDDHLRFESVRDEWRRAVDTSVGFIGMALVWVVGVSYIKPSLLSL